MILQFVYSHKYKIDGFWVGQRPLNIEKAAL